MSSWPRKATEPRCARRPSHRSGSNVPDRRAALQHLTSACRANCSAKAGTWPAHEGLGQTIVMALSTHGNHTQSPSNGTNYPMITAAKVLEGLDGPGFDAEARALFLGGNAVRVFDSWRKPGCLASRRSQRTSAEGGAPPGQHSPGHAHSRAEKATRSGMPPSPFMETGEMIEYQARNRKSAARRTGLLSGPTAADYGRALVEAVAVAAAVRDEPHPDQRTAAQSPARFDITIFRLDPPVPDDAGGGLLALLFGLQRLAVEQTIDESFREPADSLPRHPRPCDEAAPKWPAPPGQSDRQPPI
jgi:hypothetical protein